MRYAVKESYECDPVAPDDGVWVYTVVLGAEHVEEHQTYQAAQEVADALNALRFLPELTARAS